MVIRKALSLLLSLIISFTNRVIPSSPHSSSHQSPCSVLHLLDISDTLQLKITIPSNDWKSEIDDRLEKNTIKYVPLSRVPGLGYSEKIIIDAQEGPGYSAAEFCQNVLDYVCSTYSHRIIEASIRVVNGHVIATKLIVVYYLPHKQHRELFCIESHSGSRGCSGYQYAVILSEEMSESFALERIQAFARTNVALETVPYEHSS